MKAGMRWEPNQGRGTRWEGDTECVRRGLAGCVHSGSNPSPALTRCVTWASPHPLRALVCNVGAVTGPLGGVSQCIHCEAPAQVRSETRWGQEGGEPSRVRWGAGVGSASSSRGLGRGTGPGNAGKWGQSPDGRGSATRSRPPEVSNPHSGQRLSPGCPAYT